jgi:hypothetical protein
MAHVQAMKTAYVIPFAILSGLFAGVSVFRPHVLAANDFVNEFVSRDTLNIMAVIMTISIASIATIHIWFNELEVKHNRKVFGAARREINLDAFLLIWLFVGELFLLIARNYFVTDEALLSFFNGGSLLVFLGSIVTLIDIVNVVRALTPSD